MSKIDDLQTLIKSLKVQQGINQETIADAIGYSRSHFSVMKKENPKELYELIKRTFQSLTTQVEKETLYNEASLSSIESGIKLNYVIGMLAEIQEQIDKDKLATATAAKVQRLVQSDFEDAVRKLSSSS